jgi:hypothetical protein
MCKKALYFNEETHFSHHESSSVDTDIISHKRRREAQNSRVFNALPIVKKYAANNENPVAVLNLYGEGICIRYMIDSTFFPLLAITPSHHN